jgi:hypothetical protein
LAIVCREATMSASHGARPATVTAAGNWKSSEMEDEAMAKQSQPTCLRCSGPTERGLLVDHGYGIIYPLAWIAGTGRWSKLFGLRLRGQRKMPVVTYRCTNCGRIESFVEDEKWPAP